MRNKPKISAPATASMDEPSQSPPPAQFFSQEAIPLVDQVKIVGSVVPARQVVMPEPAKYRVITSISIMYGGFRVQLRAGKVVDSRSYSIEWLQQQGVKLERVEIDI